MKARHKDTGEIIELTEEGIISCNGRKYCLHQVELLPEPIDVVQPSLPSNLDEAAKEYGRNTFINECMENGVCDDHDLSDAFKAGAEWMAGQGVIMLGKLGSITEELRKAGFKSGEEYVLQLRKKQ